MSAGRGLAKGALTQLPHQLGLPSEVCGLGHSFSRAARV